MTLKAGPMQGLYSQIAVWNNVYHTIWNLKYIYIWISREISFQRVFSNFNVIKNWKKREKESYVIPIESPRQNVIGNL